MMPFDALSHRGRAGRLRELAKEALAEYDVRPERLTPLRRADNAAFLVETADNQRFALRIHRVGGNLWHPPRGEAEVASELAWLAAIRRDTDLVVPEPIPSRQGALCTVVEVEGVPEPRICVLLRWVEGRFVDDGLTPRHMERVGVFMARLHQHAASFAPPEGFVRGRVGAVTPEVTTLVVDAIGDARGRDDAAMAEAVIDRAREVQRGLGEGPEAFGLIHGDLHQENYLFHRGEVRAIDFDDCGWGHLLWDFAVTFSEVEFSPGYEALWAATLDGYRTIRPLPDDFERLLGPLRALRRLQLVLWFLELRDDPAFSDWEDEVALILDEVRGFMSA